MFGASTRALARSTWLSFANDLRYSKQAYRRAAGQVIGLGTLAVVLGFATRYLLDFASRELGDTFHGLLSQGMVFFTFLGVIMILRETMDRILKSAYQGADLPLLISSPISPASVFGIKLIGVTGASVLGTLVWLIPPWIVAGYYLHAGPVYYLVLLPVLLLLLISTVGSVAAFWVLITRFLMSPRVLRVLKVLGMLCGFAVGLAVALFWIAQNAQKEAAFRAMARMMQSLPSFRADAWAAQFLLSLIPGIPLSGWPVIGYLVASAILWPGVALFLASKFYYPGWELTHTIETQPEHHQTRRPIGGRPQSWLRPLRSPRGAIMLKDLRVLRHNPQYIMMLLLFTGIALVTIFMMASQFRNAGEPARAMDSLPPLVFQMLIYAMILGFPLTMQAFRSETDTWWLLQSLPVDAAMLYSTKLQLAAGLTSLYVCLGSTLILVLLKSSLIYWGILLLWASITATAMAAVNLAVGCLPWFTELGREGDRNPVARVIVHFAVFLMDGLLLAGPFALFAVVWHEGESLPWVGHWPQPLLQGAALALIALIYGLVLLAAYRLGTRSLNRLLAD